MQCLMTKQASQRDERKRTHKKQVLLFSIRCCNIFQRLKSSIFRIHKMLYKSVCCFSPLQTLSLIYHLFSFPTTHFQLIALKPTDDKDSFCLLPLVFDRLNRRLFLNLCKDITLNHAFGFFFMSLAIGHNRRRIGSIRVRSTRSADFSYLLQTLFCKCVCFLSLSPSDFRLVGSVFAKTDRVHPCPIDSIRQLFLPSTKTLL